MNRYLAVVGLVILLMSLKSVAALIINTNLEGFGPAAIVSDGSYLYLLGGNTTGPMVARIDPNTFKVVSYNGLAASNKMFYDAIYYNGYIYAVASDGYVYRINPSDLSIVRGPKIGLSATAVVAANNLLIAAGYDYDASNSYTKIVIAVVNPNTLSVVATASYDYTATSSEVPIAVAYNGTHIVVVGYSRTADGTPYPLIVVFGPDYSIRYVYRDSATGYGVGIYFYNSSIVAALGRKIVVYSSDMGLLTSYNLPYQICKFLINGSRAWIAANEDNNIVGNPDTFVYVGYVDLETGSSSVYGGGYGRVHALGKGIVFRDSVLFAGPVRGNTVGYYIGGLGGIFVAKDYTWLVTTTTRVQYVPVQYATTVTRTVTTTQFGAVPTETANIIGLAIMVIVLGLALFIVVRQLGKRR